MNNSKPTFLYHSGPLSISTTMLRFRGRRYKLAHIENVILKRPLFFMALAMAGLLIGLVLFNSDILYLHESLIALAIAFVLLAASWPLGTMHIHSRTLSTSGGSITWLYHDLAKAQDVIEGVLDRKDHQMPTVEI